MSDPLTGDDSPEQLRVRRELVRRLRTVDSLSPPPAPDFATRAMAAARSADTEAAASAQPPSHGSVEHAASLREPASPTSGSRATATVLPLRRRGWTRVLVGAAAAVAIGAVAVPTLPHLLSGTSSSSVGSSALAPVEGDATGAAASAPEVATRETGAPPGSYNRPAPEAPTLAQPLASGVATGPSGSSIDLAPAVERLRARLTAAPYDATSVVLRSDPTRVEVTLPVPDPAVLDLARSILPEGTRVVLLPG
ncbi:MAG: hypothetical protein M3Y71_13640 [Actinomycetota bacterium]|nr:hypothetical protein [Actinomycetota bacterium]